MTYRYHLTSLAAVFLALGLGLLVGASLANDEHMRLEQWAVIEEIENRLSELRSENTKLTEELATNLNTLQFYDEVLEQAGEAWIADRLTDRQITLFVVGDVPQEITQTLRTYLNASGARVTPIAWHHSEDDNRAAEPDQALAAGLATLLLGMEVPGSLEPLIAAGRIHFDGALERADAVVILQEPTSKLASEVADRLVALGGRGATANAGHMATEKPSSSRWENVSHVDTPAGRLRLASVLAAALDAKEE